MDEHTWREQAGFRARQFCYSTIWYYDRSQSKEERVRIKYADFIDMKKGFASIRYIKKGYSRAVYPERNDSSIMTLSILMWWVVTQTNRMVPSMTRYAATTRSRRCPRESEPLACLKFESKQRVIFPLATVAMA